MTLDFGARRWRAHLTELGLASDEGVPGWHLSPGQGPAQNQNLMEVSP
jgi:hypothetical protein